MNDVCKHTSKRKLCLKYGYCFKKKPSQAEVSSFQKKPEQHDSLWKLLKKYFYYCYDLLSISSLLYDNIIIILYQKLRHCIIITLY